MVGSGSVCDDACSTRQVGCTAPGQCCGDTTALWAGGACKLHTASGVLLGEHKSTRVWVCADGGEDGVAEQERRHKEEEMQEWKSKVVVSDTAFHAGGARPHRPAQVDRGRTLLRGPPRKLALKKTFVPAAPISMFLGEGGSSLRTAAHAEVTGGALEQLKAREAGFRNILAKEKRDLHKIGLNQSWYASLQDVRE